MVQTCEISLMDFGDIWRDHAKIILKKIIDEPEYLVWRKVIRSKEIIKKSHHGHHPIKYDNTLVVGDLNLSAKTQFDPRDIETIVITNSIIMGDVNFDFNFLHVVDFTKTFFKGNISFEKTQFVENAQFSGARFSKDANFKNAKFGLENNLAFRDSTQFEGVIFWGNTNFENAKFIDDVSFNHSRFSKYCKVSFSDAKFEKCASFFDILFGVEENINFMRVNFNGNAEFSFSEFAGNADFRDAEFKGDVNFYGIVLNTKLNKKLLLNGANFNRLRVRSWNSIKDNLDCDGPAYLSLVKSFKMQEQFDNADDCYYDYREWRRKSNDMSKEKRTNWSKMYDVVSYLSCGYGVRLRFPLAWIFGSVFVFGILYSNMYQLNSINIIILDFIKIGTLTTILVLGKVSKFDHLDSYLTSVLDQTYNALIQNIYNIGDSIYLSAMIFTGQTPVNFQPVGAWKYAVMFESVLGYLFLALFVVVLARKLIR